MSFDFDALAGQDDFFACTLTTEASPEPNHVNVNARDINSDIEFEYDLTEKDRNAIDFINAM